MATSYKYAEATVLVTVRYLAIPITSIFGYYIWGEVLTISQILGAFLIITASLIITAREMKVKKH